VVRRFGAADGLFEPHTSFRRLCWAVLDLIVGDAGGLGQTDLEYRPLADMHAVKRALLPEEMTA